MSRESGNTIRDGLFSGFDYDLQVWVRDNIVQMCGHRKNLVGKTGAPCCRGWLYAGNNITEVRLELGMGAMPE